ncbi:MAG: transglutaminase-like cysteine peptidase [Pseudomonadota bacterium]
MAASCRNPCRSRAVRGIALLALALLAGPAPAAEPLYPPIFGTREVRGADLSPFKKWTGVLEREIRERAQYEGPCTARRLNRCHVEEWRALLAGLAGRDRIAQLEAVNAFLNRAPYVTDPVNYGVNDYWASPLQFFGRDGDCEDYAIAKYVSLRQLGFEDAELRVAVVEDLNLGVAHAILIVYLDGRALVLDNQVPQVVHAERIRHYRPVYSINQAAWWLHRP